MVLPISVKICASYGVSLLRHKWFVYQAGKGVVSNWRLFKHDASKFLPSEFWPYAVFFEHVNWGVPRGVRKELIGPRFKEAVRLHKGRNDHHYEYWELSRGGLIGHMPTEVIEEMIADWFGAARAYNGSWPLDTETWGWFQGEGQDVLERMSPENRETTLRTIEATQERLRGRA